MGGPVGPFDAFGEKPARPKVACHLEREQDAACGGPDDHVHALFPGRLAHAIRHQPTDLDDALRPLQDLELLEVAIGVAPALELEVTLPVCARLLEQLLDSLRHVRHGRYSTPLTLGFSRRRGRAAPTISWCDAYPCSAHQAARSSARRSGSTGSANTAVPTWTATAPANM